MPKKEEKTSDSLKRKKQPQPTKYYSTGSTLMDLAISNKYPGGVAADGRITHIYGSNSTAKSVLAQEILGACQRSKGYGVFVDAEGTLDYDRADLFGLDAGLWADEEYRETKQIEEEVAFESKKNKDKAVQDFVEKSIDDNDSFVCFHPTSIECLFDNILGVIINKRKDKTLDKGVLVSIDSLSALPSEVELASKLTDPTFGATRAKQMSTAFRGYNKKLGINDVSVVFIDQTRQSIGIGKNNKVSAGDALKFYASTRIWLTNPKPIQNKHEVDVGVTIDFIVEKNKIAPPFRKGKLCILFDIGIDDVRANIEWLLEISKESMTCKLAKKGAWYQWQGENIGQGLEKAIEYIENNDLEKELEEEVARIWQILYESPTRKKRYA